jgi:hypothetical protein
MEVHHPHHPSHKKKWSEYIIEFVMLFTAVTLGFFAENIRESISEKHKNEELKKAIVYDLKKEIVELQEYKLQINRQLNNINKVDSLAKCDPQKVDQKEYYSAIVNTLWAYTFVQNDKSIKEAESKGIIQSNPSDSLSYYLLKYQYYMQDLKLGEQLTIEYFKDFTKLLAPEITEPELYKKAWASFPVKELPSKIGIKPISKTSNDKLSYQVASYNLVFVGVGVSIDSLISNGNKMIQVINKNVKVE